MRRDRRPLFYVIACGWFDGYMGTYAVLTARRHAVLAWWDAPL